MSNVSGLVLYVLGVLTGLGVSRYRPVDSRQKRPHDDREYKMVLVVNASLKMGKGKIGMYYCIVMQQVHCQLTNNLITVQVHNVRMGHVELWKRLHVVLSKFGNSKVKRRCASKHQRMA